MRLKSAPLIVFSNPTTIREILIVTFVVQFAWQGVVNTFFASITNAVYLAPAAATMTIIYISKYMLARTDSNFEAFLGTPLRAKDLPELFLVTAFCILLGIGCWAGLVLLDANINLDRAFARWHLVQPSAFDNDGWLPEWIVISLLATAVAGPITEEIVFRGFILSRLRSRYGVASAIFISSLIFGAMHFNKSFIGAFASGIIFAILAVRFSSLYAPLLVHALYNASVDLLRIQFGTSMVADKARIASMGYWIAELSCLAIAAIFFFVYVRRVTSAFAKPLQISPVVKVDQSSGQPDSNS